MEEKNGFKNFLCSKLGKVVMIVVLYAIIFTLVALLVEFYHGPEIVQLIVILIFGFFGWKALDRIQPRMFLFLPVIGWVIYIAVKGVLSAIVGMFVTPFVISKKIAQEIQKTL
ncbi:MAG: hypothetical protein IJZ57_04910 [Clostridia bacterium]|nr:hypothetical protein [Clostridia bacterium]